MKDSKVQNILVYTDFTEVGEKSVQWAIYLAKKFKRRLHFIHVINENSYNYFDKGTVKEDAKKALHNYCDNVKKDYGIESDLYVEEGCTCTIINSEAERRDAFMVVLGTHGKNDPQYLSGASVVKIIRKARMPYFVVQKNSPVPDNKKNILLPLGISKEMKEKTGWVTYLGKNLLSGIDVVYKESDEENVKKNLYFAKRFFDKYKLVVNQHLLPSKSEKLNKQALKFASNNDSMMMVILTTKKENIIHKIFGLPETGIISNNKGLPILCINPKKDLYIPCI